MKNKRPMSDSERARRLRKTIESLKKVEDMNSEIIEEYERQLREVEKNRKQF